MPGHGEIIFYTQQKRPPARPPPPPTPPPQSSPLAPRCRAIVIAETLPSTYTELAILLSSFLPSFFYFFSLSLSLSFHSSQPRNNYTPRLDNLVHRLITYVESLYNNIRILILQMFIKHVKLIWTI